MVALLPVFQMLLNGYVMATMKYFFVYKNKKTSTKVLKNYLKQGIADIETEDIICKELYEIREIS